MPKFRYSKIRAFFHSFLILRTIIVITIIICTIWFFIKPSFEPFVAILAGTTTYIAYLHVENPNEADNKKSRSPTKSNTKSAINRSKVLENIKQTWIKGVFENSLHTAVHLKLGLKEKPDSVARPWTMHLHTTTHNSIIPASKSIYEVFNEQSRALLILGAPGSGKTFTLLELAKKLITVAEQNSETPIPFIFNLASWATNRLPLEEWLIEETILQYRVSKNIAQEWLRTEQVCILLDGLDEVKLKYRNECVNVINEFLLLHPIDVVVCSRTTDYENLKIKIELKNAVVIQPLTHKQINTYLEGQELSLKAVRETLKNDLVLQEVMTSPLFLSIVAMAYHDLSLEELEHLSSIEVRRQHIIAKYVERMFDRKLQTQRVSFKKDEAINYLTFIATQFKNKNLGAFYVEYLQPNWLPSNWKPLYKFLVGLNGFLLSLIVFNLITDSILGLLISFLVGLAAWFGSVPIKSFEAITIKQPTRPNIRQATFLFTISLLGVGLGHALQNQMSVTISAITSGVVAGLAPLILVGFRIMPNVRPGVGEIRGIKAGIHLGIDVLLITALAIFFGFGLKAGPLIAILLPVGLGAQQLLQPVDIEFIKPPAKGKKKSPNHGVHQSLKNAVILGLIAGIASGISAGIFVGIKLGVGIGLICALALAQGKGGDIIPQHYILRILLSINRKLPLQLVPFLNEMKKRILLHQTGRSYVFIHRTIMEYFCSRDSKNGLSNLID